MTAGLVRLGKVALWLAVVVTAAPVAGAESPRHVVLITLDTFRGDYLGVNGRGSIPTPNLDRLAAGGANFSRARSSVPLTLPSHASLLTATWPHTHGLRDNGAGALAAERRTLAEVLQGRGYDTAAFVGSFVLDRRFGLARGFAHYDDRVASDVALLENVEAEREGGEVVAAFEEWLDARDDSGPLFAWVHLYDPHAPYAAPEPFAGRHRDDPYGAEIAYTDALVGRVVEALRSRGLLDASLVAVVGDHGEGLGEHGEGTHALLIYNSTLDVPMLLWAPGLVPRREVADLVRTIDLAPTILDLLAVGEVLGEGRSLAALLAGGELPPAPAFSESRYGERHLGWSPLYAVELGRYKFVLAPEPELYDLELDPGETLNRIASEGEQAGRLEALLRGEIDPGAAAETPEPPEPPGPSDPETVAKLRSLGYLAGPAPATSPNADPKRKIELWERLQRAIALYGHADYGGAAREFESVIRSERSIPLVYDYLGASYMRLERWDAAERLYDQALERGIDSAPLRIDLGLIQARRGAAREAEAQLRQALALEPMSVTAHFHLGDVYRAAGRHAAAAGEYRAALAINPNYVYAWNGLGRTLAASGDARAALAAFESAAQSAPDDPRGLLNLAAQLESMGRDAEALETYRRSLELAESPEIRDLAARALERLGEE